MSVSPATIRDRMAAAAGAVSGWSETSPFDLFSDRALRHQTFAVGLADTSPGPRARQAGVGILSTTTVQVVAAYHLRIGGRIDDYSDALDAEQTFISGILDNFDETEVEAPNLTRIQRVILDDQQTAVITTVTFGVTHYYPL